MSADLDMVLSPNIFKIAVIAIKMSITIPISIFGKYIRTKLPAKILITNAEIIKRYTIIPILNMFLTVLPEVYSQISMMS